MEGPGEVVSTQLSFFTESPVKKMDTGYEDEQEGRGVPIVHIEMLIRVEFEWW